jgi:hypothetical protein
MGALAATSVILSAGYSIYMYNRISTGSISPHLITAPDINKREFSMLTPLTVIMISLGILPTLISQPLDLGLSSFLLSGYENLFSSFILIVSLVFTLFMFINLKTSLSIIINKARLKGITY